MEKNEITIAEVNSISTILVSAEKDIKRLIALLRDLDGVAIDNNLRNKIKSATIECIIERTKDCIRNLSSHIS